MIGNGPPASWPDSINTHDTPHFAGVGTCVCNCRQCRLVIDGPDTEVCVCTLCVCQMAERLYGPAPRGGGGQDV